MGAPIQVEDRRRRVGLVYHDATYARRNHTREKLEKLSLFVAWEREASRLVGMSFEGLDGIVVITAGLHERLRSTVLSMARTAGVHAHLVSDRQSEWDDLRKWATRPFVIVRPNGASRVVAITSHSPDEPPVLPVLSSPRAVDADLEALAESYANDAELAKRDLVAARGAIADHAATIVRLERELATARATSVTAHEHRDADAKRAAAEQRCRAAESEVTEGRRELKRLRDELAKAEEDRDEAQAAAKQARKRPSASNVDKVISALDVLVESRAMPAEEAWDRVVTASRQRGDA